MPVFLSQLCQAASCAASIDASEGHFELGGHAFVALSIAQPDYSPLRELAKAELEVCHLLLEGRSYSHIARARGTKPRTTANQISAIFQKLRVSGRMALIAELIGKGRAEAAGLPQEARLSYVCRSPQAAAPADRGADELRWPRSPAASDSLGAPGLRGIVPSRGRFHELCVPAHDALQP
jgi:DNA-binding CsgD family transcriptional regulator